MSTKNDIEELISYHDDKVKEAEANVNELALKLEDIEKKLKELKEIQFELSREYNNLVVKYNDALDAKGAFLRVVKDNQIGNSKG